MARIKVTHLSLQSPSVYMRYKESFCLYICSSKLPSIYLFLVLLLFLCMVVLSAYKPVVHIHVCAHGGQKRELDPLGLNRITGSYELP